MAATKKKSQQTRRLIIILLCLALLIGLLQGASYFNVNHQIASSSIVNEIAHSLTKQVAHDIAPLMERNQSQTNIQQIQNTLQYLTQQKRILDASVYKSDGTFLVGAGENVDVRDRLALDGKRPGSYANNQIVASIPGKQAAIGFLRITLDTHVLATEKGQVDNTTNMLRLMLLLAMVIGIVLSHTLLQTQRSRWQQSPFLLTANKWFKKGENTRRKITVAAKNTKKQSPVKKPISHRQPPSTTDTKSYKKNQNPKENS